MVKCLGMSLTDGDTRLLRAVGLNIKRLRLERQLSQTQLADFACMSARYLGEVEAGKRNISLANLNNLARHLSVTTAELIDVGEEERKDLLLDEMQATLSEMSLRQLLLLNRLLHIFKTTR